MAMNRILSAKVLINDLRTLKEYPAALADIEFTVFSQCGEDGIIQFLLSKVRIENEAFVEFGVQDYSESNTRFLLVNNDWRGLIMDANSGYMKRVRESNLYWRHDFTALSAFITKENINTLIGDAGIKGDIGLLSIDIDGNDYWVWESLNVVSPRIVICEYNSVFGSKEAVSTPYDEVFDRTTAHYSNLYFGASLKALCVLAEKKGYVFVGCNSGGSNAFFVRKDVSSKVVSLNCEDGYVESRTRQSRDEKGRLTHLSGDGRAKCIGSKAVVDVVSGREKLVKDLVF